MSASSPRTVVLLSAPGTLDGIDPLLRRAGVRLIRVRSLMPRPVSPTIWLKRLERDARPDTVVVTSRAAVEAGVRPWRRSFGRFPTALEFWAVGPGTARALRQAGIRQVHRPRAVGTPALAKSLGQRPSRAVVYFRSDLAGPRLARALRKLGHRVVDLVVYRDELPARFTARARRELASADGLIVTSPSGLSSLRRRLDRPSFSRLTRTARLVVLGDRSRRAARAHGFRHISVAPSTTAQRFTRHLLRELRDAQG
jgi:uroporphyrinogen-III synthase